MKNLSLLLLSLFCCALQAQTNAHYVADSLPHISITGASTLHDWKVTASSISDYPQEIDLSTTAGASIAKFAFTVEVESLDGGRGASMNDKIYKAFVSTTNPTIRYEQTVPALLKKGEAGAYILTSTGNLSMAGVEKEITVEVMVTKTASNDLLLKGSKALKMSDFGITPPSAMFGQIQTKDDITVNFEFVYHQK